MQRLHVCNDIIYLEGKALWVSFL